MILLVNLDKLLISVVMIIWVSLLGIGLGLGLGLGLGITKIVRISLPP
jgi:hypothetical protein